MKNKIFSKGIYLDTFRRIKIIGIIFGIYLLISCVFFVGTDRVAMAPFDYLRPLYMVPYVITPVIAGVAFNIYSKRKTSDFYSSLPVSKFSRMFSISAAVVSVLIAGILLGALGSMAVIGLGKPILITTGIWDVLLTVISSTLFAFAAFVLAEALTGNVLTLIISYFVNLFFVRYLFYLIRWTLLSGQKALDTKFFLKFFMPDMNTFVGGFFNGTTFFDITSKTTYGICNLKEDLWTVAASVVLFALACVIFSKRLSEKDSSSFTSNGAFFYITGVITFVISTFPIATRYLVDGSILEINKTTEILLLFLLPVAILSIVTVIYFKNDKSKKKVLLKELPALIAVILINASIFAVNGYLQNNKIRKKIAVGDIKSVQLILDSDSNFTSFSGAKDDLETSEITDKDFIAKISESYNKSVNLNLYDTEDGNEESVICKINTKDGKTYYGKTIMNIEDIVKLSSKEKKIENYIKELPKPDYKTFVVYNTGIYGYYGRNVLKADDAEKLFKTIQDEINGYTAEQVYSDVFSDNLISIIYYSKSGIEVVLNLSPITLPKTVNAAISYFNGGKKIEDVKKCIYGNDFLVDGVSLYLKNSDGKYTENTRYILKGYTDEDNELPEKTKKIINNLVSKAHSDKDFSSGYMIVDGEITDKSSSDNQEYVSYIIPAPSNLTDEEINNINDLVEESYSIDE